MKLVEILFLAVGLSMDAFAVSICKGLASEKIRFRECAVCGVWFGLFQMLMPLLGYVLGGTLASLIEKAAPWAAFLLLAAIGIHMLQEAFSPEEAKADARLDFRTMFLLAVATSIDAFAVGITFVAVPVEITEGTQLGNTLLAIALIGLTTFGISAAGVRIGNVFGSRYRQGSEAAGGTILVFIGLNILLQHLDTSGVMQDSDAVFGMMIPFAGTLSGAAVVYLNRTGLSRNIHKILTGLAAGIMLSTAVWCLIRPVLDSSGTGVPSGKASVFLGFWIGVLFEYALDKAVPHLHADADITEGPDSSLKPQTKIMLAEVIHHIPEGISVGAVYAGHLLGASWISSLCALIFAAAIAIQNFPETFLTALSIREKDVPVSRAFLMGVVSGAAEPILGLITAIVIILFPQILPWVLALAGGAILFTVIEEMIPGISQGKDNDLGTFSFAAGFSLMMLFIFLLAS